MRHSYEIDIEATPAEVFAWLADSGRVMQWAEGVVENEDLETTPDRVGSTFRQVYEENGRRMEFQGRCTAFEADRRLGIAMTGSMFDLEVDYHLEDRGGSTRLRQESQVLWKGLMRLLGPVMGLFMKKKGAKCLEEDFGRLKALAEGGAPAGV